MTRKLIPLRMFFRDKDGKLAIVQFPNVPLITWFLFALLSHLFSSGHGHTVAHGISLSAIIIWAALEIYAGASYFRRVVGLIVLVISIASLW